MKKNNKTAIWIGIIAVSFAIIIAMTVLLISGNNQTKKLADITEKFGIARQYIDNQEYEQAIAVLNRIIEVDINNKEAYELLVQAYIQNGDYDAARTVAADASVALGDNFNSADMEAVEQAIKAAIDSSHTHEYTEGSCLEDSVCIVCGDVAKAAQGHDFAEATAWAPKTCKVCNETEGDPLPSIFEERGAVLFGIGDEATGNLEDHNIPYIVNVTDYRCFKEDATHEGKDGYVWQTAKLTATMYLDSDAWTYTHDVGYEDYYDPKYADDTSVRINSDFKNYKVVYNGREYDECIRGSDYVDYSYYPALDGEPGGSRAVTTIIATFRVPEGYDGNIIGYYTEKDYWDEGEYVYDHLNTFVGYRLPKAIAE